MIRMSEIPTWTPDLVLRLIGALTGLLGAIAGLIAVAKYFRENPKLKIEVIKCIYSLLGDDTLLFIFFNIDNVGDRGTQLKNLDASFRYEGKKYKVEGAREYWENIFVDAHKSQKVEHKFFFRKLNIKHPIDIDCTFTLHHTHNKVKFSSKAPYPKPKQEYEDIPRE